MCQEAGYATLRLPLSPASMTKGTATRNLFEHVCIYGYITKSYMQRRGNDSILEREQQTLDVNQL